VSVVFLTGPQFHEILTAGAARLARKCQEIDALNVFPVPDGDTGTNMYLTLVAALDEMGQTAEKTIGAVAAACARGAVAGARGNSGVILSQLLQGFAVALAGKEQATAKDLTEGFNKGIELAYRAVTEPVEGTILTVARCTAEAARSYLQKSSDLRRFGIYVYRRSLETLAATPNLLPVLKAAGVVDAGGRGFVTILEGIMQYLGGRADLALMQEGLRSGVAASTPDGTFPGGAIQYTYCTEFLIKSNARPPVEEVRRALEGLGDCLIVAGDGGVIRVHLHSNHPGTVMEKALRFGSLHNINVTNMLDQYQEHAGTPKKSGLVAVATGEGLQRILQDLGADRVVDGGRTMNPSVDEIANAVNATPAASVFILPNNKNVIPAAQQVQALTTRTIYVLPTANIPQGIAALMAFNPESEPDENLHKMNEAIRNVRVGEITRAARETVYEGETIKPGAFIGLLNGGLLKGNSLLEITRKTVLDLAGPGSTVTLYRGADVSHQEADAILNNLRSTVPGCAFEMYDGGQPHYHFIISVE